MFFKWRSVFSGGDDAVVGAPAYPDERQHTNAMAVRRNAALAIRPRFIDWYLHSSLQGLPFAACDRLAVLKDDEAVPTIEKKQTGNRRGGLR
jgi:hypothetical protein